MFGRPYHTLFEVRETEEEARRRDIEAFDALPAEIRGAVAAAPYPPDCRALLRTVQDLRWRGLDRDTIVQATIAAMPLSWREQLNRFGAVYQRRHKTPLPHIAAQASFLVTDLAVLPRRRARRSRLRA